MRGFIVGAKEVCAECLRTTGNRQVFKTSVGGDILSPFYFRTTGTVRKDVHVLRIA